VTLRFADLRVGLELPARAHTATNVSLFMYNAAVWNPHRIHYDAAYTTEVEKHPAIVIDGPLQGDWLSQCVLNWLGDDGALVRFAYSNRRAAYLGETLVTGGAITALDAATCSAELELRVTNERGEVTTPGSATVKLRA
jgi:3-methylfumaryl-CoA hydratase